MGKYIVPEWILPDTTDWKAWFAGACLWPIALTRASPIPELLHSSPTAPLGQGSRLLSPQETMARDRGQIQHQTCLSLPCPLPVFPWGEKGSCSGLGYNQWLPSPVPAQHLSTLPQLTWGFNFSLICLVGVENLLPTYLAPVPDSKRSPTQHPAQPLPMPPTSF